MKIADNRPYNNCKPSFGMRFGRRFNDVYQHMNLSGKISPEIKSKYTELVTDSATNHLCFELEDHPVFPFRVGSNSIARFYAKVRPTDSPAKRVTEYIKDGEDELVFTLNEFIEFISKPESVKNAEKSLINIDKDAFSGAVTSKNDVQVVCSKKPVQVQASKEKPKSGVHLEKPKLRTPNPVKIDSIMQHARYPQKSSRCSTPKGYTVTHRAEYNKEYQKEYNLLQKLLRSEQRIGIKQIRAKYGDVKFGPTFDSFLADRLASNNIQNRTLKEIMAILDNPKLKGYSFDLGQVKMSSPASSSAQYSLIVKSNEYARPITYKYLSLRNKRKPKEEFTFNEILWMLKSGDFISSANLQLGFANVAKSSVRLQSVVNS